MAALGGRRDQWVPTMDYRHVSLPCCSMLTIEIEE